MLRFMVVVVVMIVGVFVIVELEVEIFGEQLKIMWVEMLLRTRRMQESLSPSCHSANLQ